METMKNAAELLKSKAKGKGWAEQALPVLVSISRGVKEIEAKKENEAEPIRVILAGITEKYRGALDTMSEMDERIRERLMMEYKETETIAGEEGELVFPQGTGFKVMDIKKVEQRFLMVDSKAVNTEIKAGVQKIKGLLIEKVRGLQVRPRKE